MALTADKEDLLQTLRGELSRKASFYPLLQRCYRDISTGTRRNKPAIWKELIINPVAASPASVASSSAPSPSASAASSPAPSLSGSAASSPVPSPSASAANSRASSSARPDPLATVQGAAAALEGPHNSRPRAASRTGGPGLNAVAAIAAMSRKRRGGSRRKTKKRTPKRR